MFFSRAYLRILLLALYCVSEVRECGMVYGQLWKQKMYKMRIIITLTKKQLDFLKCSKKEKLSGCCWSRYIVFNKIPLHLSLVCFLYHYCCSCFLFFFFLLKGGGDNKRVNRTRRNNCNAHPPTFTDANILKIARAQLLLLSV